MSRAAGAHISEDHLDHVFHALSDRTRRALIVRLAQGPCMITDLAGPFAMSLPAVSKHIRVLEEARMIVRTVDGRIHRCALNAETLRTAQQWLEAYSAFWEDTLDALASYMERNKRRRRS